jgi:hypothetical protein
MKVPFKTLFRDWRIAEIVGFILAIIAIGVGLVHLFEIRHAPHDVRAVQAGLSTRYLGPFPKFLPAITNIVNSSNKQLVIFCDFPGYGDFSDPRGALEYYEAIEHARARDVKIDFTCMQASYRKTYLEKFFPPQEWTNFSGDVSKETQVDQFLKIRHADLVALQIRPPIRTLKQLLTILKADDDDVLRRFFGGDAHQIPLNMPIYFWIADDDTAVFSIPSLSREVSEYGFATSDHALITAFRELKDRFQQGK